MIVVIADDITGAAEIAGIACSWGCKVTLITATESLSGHCCVGVDVCVLATDSRSCLPEEAVALLDNVMSHLYSRKNILIFKKVDSVLRGHIIAELKTCMSAMSKQKALLLPQNPSKGRIIRRGVYYINDVPLADTPFSYDPEFPAIFSEVSKIVSGATSVGIEEKFPASGISLCDASSTEEIQIQLAKADENTLIAGAAELFAVWLSRLVPKSPALQSDLSRRKKGKTLVVCGSTQSRSLIDEPYFSLMYSSEQAMPSDVFHGASPSKWSETLSELYREHECLILQVGHPSQGGKDFAQRIRHIFSLIVQRLVSEHSPSLLIIEGGATAFAVLQALGWQDFAVNQEIDSGVISLAYGQTEIVLKPGSYPWGALLKR